MCEDGDDGKPTCVTCQDDFERDDAGNECKSECFCLCVYVCVCMCEYVCV